MKAPAGPFDVGVVRYGPVGQLTAALLGRAGHRVVVFERWPRLFPYPKAGHLDDEVIRILQSVGAAEEVVAGSWPMTGDDLLDREGKVVIAPRLEPRRQVGLALRLLGLSAEPRSGPPRHRQGPTRCRRPPGLGGGRGPPGRRPGRGRRWAGRRDADSGVRVCGGPDGAGSLVRESAGITRTDYGFEADFLVVHVLPHDADMEIDMPPAAQICDPARPVSIFRRHGNHNPRWEFMLLPGETAAAMETPEVCWRLIAPWGVSPANADLFYYRVYRFNSLVADRWRAGRAMLAGDVAHRMRTSWGRACAPV